MRPSVAGCGALQCALDKHFDERPPVLGRSVQVVGRVDLGCGDARHLRDRAFVYDVPVQRSFRSLDAARQAGRPDDADMSIGGASLNIAVIEQRNSRKGEVTATPGEFFKSPAPACGPSRQYDFGDDLVRFQDRLQRSDEKIQWRGSPAFQTTPTTSICASSVTAKSRHFRGRICMGETAADGAAISDLVMSDMRDSGDKQRLSSARVLRSIRCRTSALARQVSRLHSRREFGSIRDDADRRGEMASPSGTPSRASSSVLRRSILRFHFPQAVGQPRSDLSGKHIQSLLLSYVLAFSG